MFILQLTIDMLKCDSDNSTIKGNICQPILKKYPIPFQEIAFPDAIYC